MAKIHNQHYSGEQFDLVFTQICTSTDVTGKKLIVSYTTQFISSDQMTDCLFCLCLSTQDPSAS